MKLTKVKSSVVAVALTGLSLGLIRAQDPLPSWNDGPAKQAIVEFVKATTTQGSPQFVPPEQRVATFDQDGTLWVEQPMYTQVIFCLERVPALVQQRPEPQAKAPLKEFGEILTATMSGMSVEDFQAEAKKWLQTAKHPRYRRPYTELTYLPM